MLIAQITIDCFIDADCAVQQHMYVIINSDLRI